MNNDNNIHEHDDDTEKLDDETMPTKYAVPLYSLTDEDYKIPKLKFPLIRSLYSHLKREVTLHDAETKFDVARWKEVARLTLREYAFYLFPEQFEAAEVSKQERIKAWIKENNAALHKADECAHRLGQAAMVSLRDIVAAACLEDIQPDNEEGTKEYPGKHNTRLTKWLANTFGKGHADYCGKNWYRLTDSINYHMGKASAEVEGFVMKAYRRAWWGPSDFGQGGSCWWSNYQLARYASEMSGRFLPVCTYRPAKEGKDKECAEMKGFARDGRCWIYQPTSRGYLVVINAYGRIETKQWAEILARMFDLKMADERPELTGHNIYTNGGNQFLYEDGVKLPKRVPLYIYRPEMTVKWEEERKSDAGKRSPILAYLTKGRTDNVPHEGDF